MKKPLITLALCLAAYSGMGQMKFETYYGNMAGWGSTTDVGISYNNESGYFFTTRIAYIQAFGIAEDSDKISVALGTGKDWFLSEHWYTGGQLDLRWADKNLQDVGLGIIAPSIYLGYAWNMTSYQIQLGLPYLLGFQAKFSLDN
jgi:hypothetical protein